MIRYYYLKLKNFLINLKIFSLKKIISFIIYNQKYFKIYQKNMKNMIYKNQKYIKFKLKNH